VTTRTIVGWTLLGVLGIALPTFAQETGDVPVELQETDVYGMGARAMGMGMAYVGVAEDATALYHNPAGLAQVRQVELSGGFHYAASDFEAARSRTTGLEDTKSRLEHVALAYPVPTYRGSLVVGFGLHRVADLGVDLLREGFLDPAGSGDPGLFEIDRYRREGTIKAGTLGAAMDVSAHISVGASVSYLFGTSRETITMANGIPSGGGLDFGDAGSPDQRLFREETFRESDLNGWTGSVGLLVYTDSGIRVGASIDLPRWLEWDGFAVTELEDTEKIDEFETNFRDEITLPLSLKGGASWGRNGFLLAGGFRWTDYKSIDFEGEILAPPSGGLTFVREPAYRSGVALHLGAEYQLPSVPLRFRAGFFTEPLPYRLIAADTDFEFVPDDNDPDTFDDTSIIFRDYPVADIASDRKFVTLGAGVLLEEALTLDIAYVHGSWERRTPRGYENSTGFYPTLPTVESVTEDQIFVGTALHFD